MSWLEIMAVAAALSGAALPTQAAQGPAELPNAAGSWSPPGTGVSFPERAGEFRRTRIVRYKADDWSVGYDRIREGRKVGTTTVFLYVPSNGAACSTQFDGAVQALALTYPGATEISRSAAASPEGRRSGAARHARHRMVAKFDRADQEVVSDLYVYCRPGSRWTIKYRSTWPASERDGAAPELLRAIDWPDTIAA